MNKYNATGLLASIAAMMNISAPMKDVYRRVHHKVNTSNRDLSFELQSELILGAKEKRERKNKRQVDCIRSSKNNYHPLIKCAS